ncbi:MAG: hypothetical protein ACI4F1_14885 [Bariatricus sp.]
MKKTKAYKTWKVAFFAVFLALIAVPYINYELAGIVTTEVRFLFIAVITLLAYGLIISLLHLKEMKNKENRKIENFVPVSERGMEA